MPGRRPALQRLLPRPHHLVVQSRPPRRRLYPRAQAIGPCGSPACLCTLPRHGRPTRRPTRRPALCGPAYRAHRPRLRWRERRCTIALSPQEYAAFTQWVDRIKPAHSRREGLLDEHAAVKFLRSELGISVEDEVSVRALGDSRQILTLFERLPMGIQRGHFYAMVRLAAWAQQGYTATHDLLFTQSTYDAHVSPQLPRRNDGNDDHMHAAVPNHALPAPRR